MDKIQVGIVGTGIYLPKDIMTAREISKATKGVWSEAAVIDKLGIIQKTIPSKDLKKDGTQEMHYIPTTLMRGEKENPYSLPWNIEQDWSWANPKYSFSIARKAKDIELITIDPSYYMADVDRDNNTYQNE